MLCSECSYLKQCLPIPAVTTGLVTTMGPDRGSWVRAVSSSSTGQVESYLVPRKFER